MAKLREILAPELTWSGSGFAPDLHIGVDLEGRIAFVEPAASTAATTGAPVRRLARRALLPGFVNVHSHAFQRALRGWGETYPAGMGDFWSWRAAMYALVERLSPDEFRRVCKQAFREMRSAGYTTIGEFHYVHHAVPQNLDFELDRVVIETAAEVGVRLVLLMCYYKTGGVDRPLAGGQSRFATPDVPAFLSQVESVQALLKTPQQSLGLAPHSLRAVPADDLRLLCREAAARGLTTHVHIEEQLKEIEEVHAALGCTPMEWLLDNVQLGPDFTAVHCTHAERPRLERYLATGAHVCLCPITEGNLGDGICDLSTLMELPGSICIGSDSNIRLDPFEELRWLEFVQRLARQKRGVTRHGSCDNDVARQLLRIGTLNGATALGVPVGEITATKWADFAALDLDHPHLAGWTPDTLAAAAITGAGAEVVAETCVGGEWQPSRRSSAADD